MPEQNGTAIFRRNLNGHIKLWVLVKFVSFNKTHYEVFSSDKIRTNVDNENADLNSMHSGKIVYVEKGNALIRGVIEAISDERQVLLKEIHDLMMYEEEEHSSKRPKLDDEATNAHYNHIHDSNGVLTGPVNVRRNSLQRRSSTASRTSRGSQRRSPNRKNAPMNNPSVIRSNPSIQSYQPMTFHQQTQTQNEGRDASVDLDTIISHFNGMVQDLQGRGYVAKQLVELAGNMRQMKAMVKEMIDMINMQADGDVSSASFNHGRNNSVISNAMPSPRILNLSQQSPRLLNNSLTIEPVMDTSNDSYSYQSRGPTYASNQSLYQVNAARMAYPNISPMNRQMEHSGRRSFDLGSAGHSNTGSSSSSIQSAISNADIYSEDIGDPNEEVVLGTNNTTVPRSLLLTINWSSHTSATRTLLLNKFSRDILATHSLTGKQSPGMCINKNIVSIHFPNDFGMQFNICSYFSFRM